MTSISEKRFNEIIEKSRKKKVLVIGDLMIDQYLFGDVTRISPEAPVPVIEISDESIRFGGAANVALNVSSLGCIPILSGIIGKDKMAEEFIELMNKAYLNVEGIFQSKDRPTTVKTRIIGQSQQIARLDRENNTYLNNSEENKLKNIIEELVIISDAIIFEDYNKGVLTKGLIKSIIGIGNENDLPIFVDPKFENFMEYKNVTFFKPNIKETEQALAIKIQNDSDLVEAGRLLISELNNEKVLITRGSKGMSLFESDGTISHIPTKARNVADVSGAGDTVISTLCVALLGGASNKEAVTIANYAAGIVCEEVGIVPIALEKLKKACIE